MDKNNILYNEFVNSVEIRQITIPKLSWEVSNYPESGEQLSVIPDIDWLDPKIIDETFAEYGASLTLEGLSDNCGEPFLTISIVVKMVIKFDKNLFSQENIQLYQFRNAALSLMAILREQVRNATVQIGLPQLILPTFKIIPDNPLKEINS
ncbi:MAG TPA: hypothetical protein ENJ10_15115 [Caldithrix abyssi]|uniref:Preprotein translocase subunit SecB n=1 Tax=Caldithrix abyssi TaxID=187145 RepID=A0A7V1LPZ2_CALAY|nr:hypothetical protein [Caldithrix abyssi]